MVGSVQNPTLEKLAVLSARLDFVEKLLDEQFCAAGADGRERDTEG